MGLLLSSCFLTTTEHADTLRAENLTTWLAPSLPLLKTPPLALSALHVPSGAFQPAPPNASRARSIGPTNIGYLKQGKPLAPTQGLALRPSTLKRDSMWGTDALVDALSRAAERIERRWPGSILYVGDLSRPQGGAFPPHASHQNGRDVDLCFYLSDAEGHPADNPLMTKVDTQGRTFSPTGTLYFDVARNWALIQALLEDPHIQIQWIFVADYLRQALLAEAEAQKSPLFERASKVLMQPRDSSPHAEHFHIRIYCGLEERLEGCLDAPPWHSWISQYEDALNEWLAAYLPFLERPFGEEFERAIEAVVSMNARDALPYLEKHFDHPELRIRTLAQDAHAFLSNRRTPRAWERFRAREVGD